MRPESPFLSPECEAFDRQLHAVLDGVAEPAELTTSHAAACVRCRKLAASVRVFREIWTNGPEPIPVLDSGFAGRVVLAATMDRRSRMRQRRLVGSLAMAAGVLLAVITLRPWFTAKSELANHTPLPAPTPVHVGDQFSEASSAIAALTRRTADETVVPTLSLIPVVDPPREIPSVAVSVPPEPAVDSLAEMPNAVQAGLEPMTTSTRRAINLFLRDTGLSPSPKPNS